MYVLSGLNIVAANVPEMSFSGTSLKPITVTPERSTGIDLIYVLYNTNGVSLSVPISSRGDVRLLRYSNLGGGYAQEVTNIEIEDNTLTLSVVEGNMGYIVEDGDKRYYYWIVSYEPYRFVIDNLSASPEQTCDYTSLAFSGNAAPIYYYAVNGQQKVLDREIRLEYDTQEWNESTMSFETISKIKMLESLDNHILVTPPVYCSTSFNLSGDRFLRQWNWNISAETSVIAPAAVNAVTTAVQEKDNAGDTRRITKAADSDSSVSSDEGIEGNGEGDDVIKEDESNQIHNDEDGLGGSAPSVIDFDAYVTEGVIHHEWQMSKDSEFGTIDYRFNEQNLNYTFDEEGTFYLRYIGSNSDGSCETISDTYTVSIGASELLCPNAFTPNGDGINDKWKVAYRSLLDFKCWIFDRYGRELYYFDNPADGWDGMRGDKPVAPGVYYYVIQATGADGKKYKKSGDINIIRHVDRSSSSGGDNVVE